MCFLVAGQRRGLKVTARELPGSVECGMERPPDCYGYDQGHPHVHGKLIPVLMGSAAHHTYSHTYRAYLNTYLSSLAGCTYIIHVYTSPPSCNYPYTRCLYSYHTFRTDTLTRLLHGRVPHMYTSNTNPLLAGCMCMSRPVLLLQIWAKFVMEVQALCPTMLCIWLVLT